MAFDKVSLGMKVKLPVEKNPSVKKSAKESKKLTPLKFSGTPKRRFVNL